MSFIKKFKRLICVCSVCLSGCTSNTISRSSISIGITIYDEEDTFIQSIVDYIDEINDDDQVHITVRGAQRSQTTQNDIVDDFITDGMQVIVVNLVERTGPSTMIQQAQQNNIPIIFFNREPLESDLKRWNQLYYVGADAYESGRMQAEIVASYLRFHPEVDINQDGYIQTYIIEGEAGHQDAIIRSETALTTLETAGIKLDKVGYAQCDWQIEPARTQMNQLISDNTHIELLLSNNDDMAYGITLAYQDHGIAIEERPIIVGIDGTSRGIQLVQDHEIIGTVYNDYQAQATSIYELALALAKKESLENFLLQDNTYIFTHYQKITSQNVNDFVVK